MAQDDVLLPTMLEQCVSVLAANKSVTLVSTGRTVVDETGVPMPSEGAAETPETLFGRGSVYPGEKVLRACLIPLRNIIGEPCTVLFRSQSASRGFSEQLFHLGDLEFWLRLLREGDYSYIPEELVKFRRHKQSATSRNIAQLRIASDIVQLAKLLSCSLADLGSSETEFIRANVSNFAATILAARDAGALDEGTLLGDERLSREEEFGLKKSLLYALMLVAESSSRSIALRDAYIVGKSEAKLRSLLESFPWRATRLLRELNRLVSCLSNRGTNELDGSSLQFDDQQEYLGYLRLQQRKIVKSRSWKVGRRLRSLSRRFSKGARNGVDPLVYSPAPGGSGGSAYDSVLPDSKRIFSDAAGQRESDLLLTDLDRLHDIEPLVPEAESLGSLTELRTPLETRAGRAYFKLCQLLEEPFSHLFLMPSASRDRTDEFSMNVVRCVAERLGPNAPLVLLTDSAEVAAYDRLPPAVRQYALDSLHPGLSETDKELLLLRFILQARPVAVTNVNSLVGWNLYRNFSRQLATASHLSACLVDDAFDGDSASGGLAVQCLNHCIEQLSHVFVDSDRFRNKLVDRCAFGDADSKKLLVVCAPLPVDENVLTTGRLLPGNRDVLWASFAGQVSSLSHYWEN
jgi:hypothetical protein